MKTEKFICLFGTRWQSITNLFGAIWQLWKNLFSSQRIKNIYWNRLDENFLKKNTFSFINFCLFCYLFSQPKVGDVFIGYHADTAASVILQVCQLDKNEEDADISYIEVVLYQIKQH